MRVAFVSVHTSPLAAPGEKSTGGMNVYLRETARELGRRGICVDIFTRRHGPEEPAVVRLADHVRVVHLAAGHPSEPKHALYQHLPAFTHDLEEFAGVSRQGYDLIHAHYWLSGMVGLELKRKWGAPLVANFHTLGKVQRLVRVEPESRYRVRVEERVVEGADQIIAGSPDERDNLLRLYGASPRKTNVVPCGFDRQLFYPRDKQEARRALGLAASSIALFVGRMDRIKGAEIMLRAAASLQDKDGLLIIVVGGSPEDGEAKRLRAIAADLKIEGHLLFLGSVPHESLPLYYSAADVCMVPSYYETFGLVAVEAMACGTPVIAARVGGLQATIIDGKTGYLVPWHCPEPYAERLETILGNEILRRSLGEAAHQSVAGLTWSFVAESLLSVYHAALGTPAESSRIASSCA